jgi:hypothetical protein
LSETGTSLKKHPSDAATPWQISFADCRDQAVSFRLPTTNAPNPIAKNSSVDVVSARVEQPSMCQPPVL